VHRLCLRHSLLLALAAAPRAFAGDVGAFPSVDGRYKVLIATVEGQPELAERRVTALSVRVVPESGEAPAPTPVVVGPPAPPFTAEALAFAARMPEHGHGMPLAPKLAQTGPDTFRVDGVKLPMPGVWELAFEIAVQGAPVRFVAPVTL
jgi:hypothetical protein